MQRAITWASVDYVAKWLYGVTRTQWVKTRYVIMAAGYKAIN